MGAPKPEYPKGTAFGCWVIVREAAPGGRGRQRFLCRASCCGQEKIMLAHNLARRPAVCVHCKGNGQKKAEAAS